VGFRKGDGSEPFMAMTGCHDAGWNGGLWDVQCSVTGFLIRRVVSPRGKITLAFTCAVHVYVVELKGEVGVV
jgi:hypothetical protein